jgi:hypothetical protein
LAREGKEACEEIGFAVVEALSLCVDKSVEIGMKGDQIASEKDANEWDVDDWN